MTTLTDQAGRTAQLDYMRRSEQHRKRAIRARGRGDDEWANAYRWAEWLNVRAAWAEAKSR